jgi:predicted  nucleic acid-binding Zn-ribbon protein
VIEFIHQLLVLQDRDTTLAKVIHDLERIPKEEALITNQLQEKSQKLEDLKANSKKLEIARKELELQVKSKQEQISKYSGQQLQTKKNDEFQALGHQIEAEKNAIKTLEDRELELMEQYDAAQKAVAEESKNVQAYAKEAESLRAQLKTKAQSLEIRKAELTQQITHLEPTFDEAIISPYRHILKSKKDVAIVPIVHGDTCGGCHMKVPHQTAISAKAGNGLTFCDQCGRILYLQES